MVVDYLDIHSDYRKYIEFVFRRPHRLPNIYFSDVRCVGFCPDFDRSNFCAVIEKNVETKFYKIFDSDIYTAVDIHRS